MNLPGYQKEDIKGEVKDGYLTVTATTSKNNDEKDKDGKYIRKERYSGSCSRSFYVGDAVTQDDVKAKRCSDTGSSKERGSTEGRRKEVYFYWRLIIQKGDSREAVPFFL